MNTTVYKYPMMPEIELPKGAEILKFAHQKGITDGYFIWAAIDPGEIVTEKRNFEWVFTGYPIQAQDDIVHKFIDTAFSMNDTMVVHLFEKVKINN